MSTNAAKVGASPKIRVLESGKEKWDVIKSVANFELDDDAFYVLDIDDIVRKHNLWKLKFPRVTPFYAVKCNDNITVLETLVAIGTSFDCASKNEISKVLDLGVTPDRIIYANTSKQISHIRHAAGVNVNLMTFDNDSELYKIKKYHPMSKMILRIRCDAKLARCKLGDKFGVFQEDAEPLIALARELDINLVGISFHVGSLCGEPEAFKRCISIGRQIFDLASRKYGYRMTILDLGGGYPGHLGSSLDEISTIINTELDRHFPVGCGVDIIAEPGRYYVTSAFTLAACIHGRRKCTSSDNGNKETSYYYYISDGVYGSFLGLVADHATAPTPTLLKPRSGPHFKCTIWGPSCCSSDRIPTDCTLPAMDVGDWLVFENMGDYTLSMAGTFNGFPIPQVYPVVQLETRFYLEGKHPFTEGHFIEATKSNPSLMYAQLHTQQYEKSNV